MAFLPLQASKLSNLKTTSIFKIFKQFSVTKIQIFKLRKIKCSSFWRYDKNILLHTYHYWVLHIFNTFFLSHSSLKITVTHFAKKYFCSSARRSVLSTSFLSCHTMAEIAKLLFKNYPVFFLPKIFNVPYAHHYKPTLDYKSFLNTNCSLVKKFKKKKHLK